MNSKEIAELAAWTAKTIQSTLQMDGRELDDAGADIIREALEKLLTVWQRGEKITNERMSGIVKEVFARRRDETKTFDETFNAVMILFSKFPAFAAEQQSKRDAEAARLAAVMPAVKV